MAKLIARITWRSAASAASPLVVALLFFGVHVLDVDFGGRVTPRNLELALTYELLLIHAFAFLGMAAVARPKRWWTHLLRALCFGGLLLLYCLAAHEEDGWYGVLTLFALGLATYAGFFFRIFGEQAFVELGVRWLVNTITLLFGVGVPVGIWIAVVEGGPAPQMTEVPAIGMFYFGLLACFELFRLYDALIEQDRRSNRRKRRRADSGGKDQVPGPGLDDAAVVLPPSTAKSERVRARR